MCYFKNKATQFYLEPKIIVCEMSLQGKVAVITGAASGLGKGFALAFVKEGTRTLGRKKLELRKGKTSTRKFCSQRDPIVQICLPIDNNPSFIMQARM